MVLVPLVSRTLADSNSEAVALDPEDPAFENKVSEVINNATSRWLRNDEVLSVLERFQEQQPVSWPNQAASEPPGGTLYIFSRKICRKFRDDKHVWRKKNDNKTVKETHEKLKVGDRERLNCYYAHAESGNGLQRRCYWILDKDKDDVVMVHYLCTSTSRVGGGRSSLVSMQEAPSGISVKSRPQRAAAQRARLGTKAFHDEEEDVDFLHGWSGQSSRQIGVTVGSGSVVGLRMESMKGRGREGAPGEKPTLDGPLESLLNLPSIGGRDNSLDARLLERNPGLLHISEDQAFALAGVHSPTKSPQKKKGLLPQLSFGIDLGEIFSENSMNLEDMKLLSPTKSRKKLSSETSEHLLIPGFSRLDSLAEYFPGLENDTIKDGYLGASGVAFLGKANSGSLNLDRMARSDSYNMSTDLSERPSSSSGQQQDKPIKVETIRRITAPGTFEKSHFNFAQHVDGSPSSDSKTTHRRRSNPTSVMPKQSMVEKMAAAAMTSTDTNTLRRENQLQKARDAREGDEEIDKSQDDHDGGLLIEPPNVLFRMQSHIVDGVVKPSEYPAKEKGGKVKVEDANDPAADKTASLFKQMSIDRPQLPDLMLESFENPAIVEEFVDGEGGSINGGFGSEQDVLSKSVNNNSETESVHGSRDPSLSSLLDGTLSNAFKQSDPGASMSPRAADILKESLEIHRARMKRM
eukprot:jgi/Picsp_1/5364/NSC_02725-R1_calmodulin-binding transcription activator 1